MKTDRLVFLALAGSIAGSACHVSTGEEYPQPSTPGQAAPASPPVTSPPPGTVSPRITTIRLQGAPAPASAPSSAVTAAAPSAPPGACTDNGVASVPDCSALPGADPSCSPVFSQQKCAAYRSYFNPKVAAAAVSCLVALSSRQSCDTSLTYGCGRSALAHACPDPSVAQLCGIAATACKSSPSDCTSTLSGLNDQGKQQVAQCVAQGCSAGLSSCVDALTPPSTSSKSTVR